MTEPIKYNTILYGAHGLEWTEVIRADDPAYTGLRAEVERLKEFQSETMIAAGKSIDALTAERDELKKAVLEKWNQPSEEAGEWGTYRVCIFCGRYLMIGNRGLLEHPAEVDCIVLKCHPTEGV